MFNFSVSTDIKCSAEQLWELLDDTEKYPDWIEVTDRMLEVAEGGLKLGAVYREYGGIPPFKGESTWNVTVFEPYSRQVHIGDDGAMTITLEILINPHDDVVTLVQNLRFKPRWWIFPMSLIMWPALMGRRGRAAIEKTQANAKAILEATAPD
ncbi:MAG: SRPBCC family protein [Chloroflexi bacterium]|nr:SRPBCC family protein [Chloroflexota bacterium]